MRQVWAGAGVPSARSVLATDETTAHRAAADLGYPVVVKPRDLAGGAGVSLARNPAELARAYAAAAGAAGVLVEEYLDGPQISVESVLVRGGRIHPVAVGTRHTGPASGFATTRRLISGAHQAEQLAPVRRVVEAAHAALGLCEGVTHTEVRLTGRGPRLVGLNARLGDDLISRLVPLATGVDLGAAAVDAALGEQPRPLPTRRRSAGVVFRHPDPAGAARPADLPLPDGVETLWTAPDGRSGHAVVVADDDATCQDRLDQAYAALIPMPAHAPALAAA
jgi:biotin carboxylase